MIGFSDYFGFFDNRVRLNLSIKNYGEFDPGSERTLAACLIHASRARKW